MSIHSRILVSLQFICLTYLVIFNGLLSEGYLLILQGLGLLLAFWAVTIMRPGKFNIQPELKPNASFINSGPYRFIRNPMYTGLIMFFSTVLFNNSIILTKLIFILLVLVLLLKIRLEEKFLTERFGAKYQVYKKRTARLFPFLF